MHILSLVKWLAARARVIIDNHPFRREFGAHRTRRIDMIKVGKQATSYPVVDFETDKPARH